MIIVRFSALARFHYRPARFNALASIDTFTIHPHTHTLPGSCFQLSNAAAQEGYGVSCRLLCPSRPLFKFIRAPSQGRRLVRSSTRTHTV